jgi:hypothetical protein
MRVIAVRAIVAPSMVIAIRAIVAPSMVIAVTTIVAGIAIPPPRVPIHQVHSLKCSIPSLALVVTRLITTIRCGYDRATG